MNVNIVVKGSVHTTKSRIVKTDVSLKKVKKTKAKFGRDFIYGTDGQKVYF